MKNTFIFITMSLFSLSSFAYSSLTTRDNGFGSKKTSGFIGNKYVNCRSTNNGFGSTADTCY